MQSRNQLACVCSGCLLASTLLCGCDLRQRCAGARAAVATVAAVADILLVQPTDIITTANPNNVMGKHGVRTFQSHRGG